MIIESDNLRDFGYEIPPSIWYGPTGKKRKTWAKCDSCNSVKLTTYYSYNKNTEKNNKYLCIKCISNTKKAKTQRSDQAKKAWKKASFRESQISRISSMFKSEKHRKLVSERNKKSYLDDPDKYLREKVSHLQTDKAKKNHRKAVGEEEYKNLHRNLALERFKDPKYKAKHLAAVSSDGYKRKISKSLERIGGFRSKLEKTVASILDSCKIDFKEQKSIGPYNFDFFLPDFSVYIEVQGEYWHSLPKNQKRDASKFSYFEKACPHAKILFLHERDFFNTQYVRHKILKFLGEDGNLVVRKFSYGDVSIEKCETDVGRFFLDQFHYAQFGRSSKIMFGCFLDNDLIAVSKFSPPVRKEVATSLGYGFKNVLELDRFCIHPEYQKKNFASWFISRSLKSVVLELQDIVCFVSFSDSTYGHFGTIYKASNWTEVSKTAPDYHYINEDGWMMHKKTLYNHARSLGIKESVYSKKHGYEKVFGKEKTKFIFTVN